MDTGLGHGQGNTGRQGSEPGEGKDTRQPEGPTVRTRRPPAGTVWGGGRGAGWGWEVRPANQGRSRMGHARRRSAGAVEGGLPPFGGMHSKGG